MESCFPDILKRAEVAALFERLDDIHKENYRPVSVLTALSKVFAKVSGVQLSSYFEFIFSKFLSGIRPTLSCQTSLLKMIEAWKQSIDNGKMVGTIAVDVSKAFDSLAHGLLIAKLAAYGVEFYCCGLLASYLYNLHQKVKLGNIRCEWSAVTKGVRQGPIQGPILFNVFINDIFSWLWMSHLHLCWWQLHFLFKWYNWYNSLTNGIIVFINWLKQKLWRQIPKKSNQCWFHPIIVMLMT